MRGQLAAIDHNRHCTRPQAKTKQGKPRYRRKWMCRSKRWTACPVLVDKTYSHLPMLMATILSDYTTRNTPIDHGSQLAADDPQHITGTLHLLHHQQQLYWSKNMSSAFTGNEQSNQSGPPPPTTILVEEHVQYFRR